VILRVALPFLLVTGAAWAAVPSMDSQTTCAHLAQEMDRPELLPRCLADEVAAKARLEPHWDERPLDIAGGCTAAVLEGQPGSHQILSTCVEDRLAEAGPPSLFPAEAE
jgi:hypothetical protein